MTVVVDDDGAASAMEEERQWGAWIYSAHWSTPLQQFPCLFFTQLGFKELELSFSF